MSAPKIIQTHRSTYDGGHAVNLSVTNGTGGVSMTLAEEWAHVPHERLSLTPDEAVTTAIALLNAAQNARDGEWMGDTDSRERALFVLGVVGPQGTEESAEAISDRIVRDFAGHDGTPVMALTKLMERSDFRAADILVMIRKAVRLARA